jgi:hypothetical protein
MEVTLNRVSRVNAPSPAAPPQALWRDVEVAPLGTLAPEASISILVDGEDAAPGRDMISAAGYPADLVEVAALGDAPGGDVVVVVPPDAAPVAAFLEAHARWHHAAGDVVSLGPVCPRSGEDDSGLSLVRDLTRDFTDPAGGHHLAAADGTIAVRRELFEEAGGAGTAPAGLRRLDLLYRLHCAGALFADEPEALAYGAPGDLAPAVARACEEGRALELELPEVAALVALPPFRETASARRRTRAALAVNVPVVQDTPAEDALATIAGALGGRLGDLELRVQIDPRHPAHEEVAAAVAADARAGLDESSLGEASEVPFQVTVPPVAALDPRTLADVCELALGEDAGALHVTVPGAAPQDAMIEVVATAAWRRSKRLAEATGEPSEQVLGRLFGERWVSGVEVSTRRHGVEEPQVTEHGPLAAATDLDHERNAHLRFRERANDLAERAETLGRRTILERLRAREERRAAERVEARLPDR